jgi:hypothetical protein
VARQFDLLKNAGSHRGRHGLKSGHARVAAYRRQLRMTRKTGNPWEMKLRLDLLEQLTPANVLKDAAANQHRYKAEPSFSQTGIGHLSPRSIEDSANEAARSQALTRKLMRRLKKNGKKNAPPR